MNNHQTRSPHFLLVLFSILSLSLLSACNNANDEIKNKLKQHITQGKAYLKQHQLQAASKEANSAIKIDATQLDAYLVLVNVHEQLGQLKEALRLLEKFNGKKDSEYYFTLLNNYQESHKKLSASKLLSAQSNLLSTQPLRLQLAQAKQWIAENKLDKAQQILIQLKTHDNYKIKSQLALANIHILKNNRENALTLLTEINKNETNNYQAHLLQGQIYADQQQYNQAERAFTLALNVLPHADLFTAKKIYVLQTLIRLLNTQGRSSEAVIYSQLLSAEFPELDSTQQQYTQASNAFTKGELKQAKEILQALLKKSPKHDKAITLLGIIYYQQGDITNAQKHLAKVIDPELSSTALTEIYALTQLKLNRAPEVLLYLEKIPEERYTPDTWALYITASLAEKQMLKSKNALDKALILNPSVPRFILLQNIYFNLLEKPPYTQALQSLKEALKQHPQHSQLQLAYIQQLLKMDDSSATDRYIVQLQTDHPNIIATQLIIVNYYVYQKNNIQARLRLAHILSIEKNNLSALYLLNDLDKIEGKWSKTLFNYKNIMQIDPLQLRAYIGLISSLLQLKQDPLENQAYLPDNYQPALLALTLSSWAMQTNKLSLASKLSLQAKEKLPENLQERLEKLTLQITIKKAQNLFAKQQYTEARKLISLALDSNANNTQLLNLSVHIEIQDKQYNQAQNIINNISLLLVHDLLVNSLQAELYLAQGERKKAIVFYEKVLKEQPKHLVSLNNLAWLYFQEGDKRALNIAQTAYKIESKNASIIDTYGWILAHNNQYEKGKKLLKHALSLAPENQEIKKHLQQIENL